MHTNLVGYQPAYVLYCVGVDGRREDLSQQHEANSEDHLPWGDGSWLDEVPSLRQMLPAHLRRGFRGVDTRDGFQQQIVEVSPKGGTLVLFDSVAVPHEVAPTVAGDRLALSGHFHEDTQVPRAWLDKSGDWHKVRGWAHYGDDEEQDH